jgi:hypothetical protein
MCAIHATKAINFQKLCVPCCAVGKLGKLKAPGAWPASVGTKAPIAEEGCTQVKTNSQMYIMVQNKFIYSHPCLKERKKIDFPHSVYTLDKENSQSDTTASSMLKQT